MKSTIKWFLVLLITALSSSCSNSASINSHQDDAFKNLNPNCELNSKIQFLTLQIQNEYRSGTLINLNITNTSNDSIIFPDGFNVKILYFDTNNQDWVEIKNDIQYVPSTNGFHILEPVNSGLASYSVVLIMPILPGNVEIDTRVVIIGNVYGKNKKTNECIGAYIDIQILPE